MPLSKSNRSPRMQSLGRVEKNWMKAESFYKERAVGEDVIGIWKCWPLFLRPSPQKAKKYTRVKRKRCSQENPLVTH